MRPVALYIPAYNAEPFLRRTLQAVQAQTHPIQEVVVIDDGSQDRSVEIAGEMGARVVRHDGNLGLAQARRTAFEEIDAPLIASLDADCEPEPTWLAVLMRAMASPAVAGASGLLIESRRQSVADLWRSTHMKQSRGTRRILCPDLLFGNNNVLRREAVLEVGSYPRDPVYRTNNEDFYISRRLRERGWLTRYEPAARAYHHRTDTLRSINRTYWRWYFLDRRVPSTLPELLAKAVENLLRGGRYALWDARGRSWRLLPFDLVSFPLLQTLEDLSYYRQHRGEEVPESRYGKPDSVSAMRGW